MPTIEKKSVSKGGRKHVATQKNGGARPGAGRPKGSVSARSRTLQDIKNRIADKADDILNAEIIGALGANVVLVYDEDQKKYVQVTDTEAVVKVINEYRGGSGEVDGKHYIVATEPGNYKSRQYLFDRAFGRPSQSVEVSADPQLVQIKNAIEARAKDRGVTFNEELQLYLELVGSTIVPEIKDKLASELVN